MWAKIKESGGEGCAATGGLAGDSDSRGQHASTRHRNNPRAPGDTNRGAGTSRCPRQSKRVPRALHQQRKPNLKAKSNPAPKPNLI